MRSTIVILAARDEMRSHALGVITIALGTGPIGSLMIGSVAERTGAQLAMSVNAVVGLMAVGLAGRLASSFYGQDDW